MEIEDESVAPWLLAEIGADKSFADKYQVEGELGFGAAGVVIGARHRVLDQRVAIKFLLSGKENTEAVARFLREARTASRIRNEHVVRVIDASTLASGIPYLVMEYLDGIDLERMLHQSPHRQLPIADAIDLILQTGEALAECHCAGIVHRDLKPSNLFCVHGADGLPMIKVLDFGIAKLGTTTIESDPPERAAAAGVLPRRVFGSPAYMSPEQFESSTDVDLRSDIWAIGVLLYEFVTGELPFQETSIYRIRKRVTEEKPRPIRELRRDSPADLWSVILKCMEKDPNQRYSNLADLAKALRPFASPRAQHSVARIVRTIESPGSDTAALSLHSTASGRSSISPIARAARESRSPRTAAFGAVALLAAAGPSLLWLNARRSPVPAIAPQVSSRPTPANAGVLVASASPLLPTPARESSPATIPVVRSVALRPPNPNHTAGSSGSSAPVSPVGRAAVGAQPLLTSSARSVSAALAPPALAMTSSPSVSAVQGEAGAPAVFVAPDATSTSSKWPIPIVEQRKRSH
jgi:serine/threonine protein kinase